MFPRHWVGIASWRELRGMAKLGVLVMLAANILCSPSLAQRPPTDRHVPELSEYLSRVQIAEPIVFRQFAVYPVLLEGDSRLRGQWLTMDEAIRRGVLVVNEKGEGSVPVVVVENRSRDQYVLIVTGEIIAGGKQTRTVRQDVIVGPGQRIDLGVFCVERGRWSGQKQFAAAGTIAPHSLQAELRAGADQGRVWEGVASASRALRAESRTESLQDALTAPHVAQKLSELRRGIMPKLPNGTVGYIFVDRNRALAMHLFGNEDMASRLLPKLLDACAIDTGIIYGGAEGGPKPDHRVAIEFYERVCQAGSQRAETPGSGAGIRTRAAGLLGDGVSFEGQVVHYGVQSEVRILPVKPPVGIDPPPRPAPPIIWPREDLPEEDLPEQ